MQAYVRPPQKNAETTENLVSRLKNLTEQSQRFCQAALSRCTAVSSGKLSERVLSICRCFRTRPAQITPMSWENDLVLVARLPN